MKFNKNYILYIDVRYKNKRMAHKMVCGSSYNYNMPGLMGGTGFMPSFVSGMGYSGCSSIFTQMFGGAMGGCNPFVTSYAQPDFNAMAGWAVADSLLNMGTMLVCAGLQCRKDNSVENTQDDVIQLQKKVDAKEKELKSAEDVLESETGLKKQLADVNEILKDGSEYKEAYDEFRNTKSGETNNLTNDVIDKKNAYLKAKKDQVTIQEKINVQVAKVEKLQKEYDALEALLKAADEKLDNQQLEKMLKRKTGTAYEAVKNKFSTGAYGVGEAGDPVADLYGVLNAYKNDADESNRETYAEQFFEIYEYVPAKDKDQFYSAYKLLKDNHQ